ncbi:MAG: amino acid adenylation domain-containing protein, partial [Bryobacteraceae bacterium]
AGIFPGRIAAEHEAVEVPLTPPQREIFLSLQLGDGPNCAFNESLSLDLHGSLNQPALVSALKEVLNRHDALRSTVSPETQMLVIHPRLELDVAVSVLTKLSSAARDAALREILDDHASTPFDIVSGPLVRANLVRMEAEHHVLIVTFHHIICDGWSINILLGELAQLYNDRTTGHKEQLTPAVRFGDYARGLAAEIDQDHKKTRMFWMSEFKDMPAPLDLPLDRPRPAIKSFEGSTFRAHIPAEEMQSVRKAGAKHGGTLVSTLLAGFHVLLHRLSRQEDLVVGIPTAGQSMLDDQNLVGHCVHFLPVRAHVEGSTRFSDLVAAMRKKLLDISDHQDYTFGTLVQDLKVERDPARLPLVEVQFNVEQVGSGIDFTGVKASIHANGKAFVNFDLFLNIVESPTGLSLECDYNTTLLDGSTVERWLRHYREILRAVAADTSLEAGAVPLLDADDRRTVLTEPNQTASEYPRHDCLHWLIEKQVERTPHKVAVECGGRKLTYAELNDRAGRLAGLLRSYGAGPNKAVAVCLPRSVDLPVALLAVLKSGSYYIPLDPGYPKERVEFVLEESGAVAVLSEGGVEVVKGSQFPALLLDWDCDRINAATAFSTRETNPSDLAYTIYTSGSTGKPKGVQIQHQALVNFLWGMMSEPGMTENDRLLAVTTVAFDIAGLEMFLPLTTGATVVIAERETTIDGTQLAAVLNNEKISVLQATPATWRLLLEAEWSGKKDLKMLCGGEALPRDLAERLLPLGAELWNMYGPTETTIWSSVYRVVSGEGPVPVGKPMANTTFYVLDSRGQLTPPGVPGELYIGGDGVATGYFQRAELTAEKFIIDPFRGAGARMFRTGDLARLHSDGTFEVMGRLDNQVKLRGYRIELGEIESVVRRHPSVSDAAVMLRDFPGGDKRLVAYAALRPGAQEIPDIDFWRTQWNHIYASAAAADGNTADVDRVITGWTRLQNAQNHVDEWMNNALDRISVRRAKKVLEIGCGTGQLCVRLAPSCTEYWGIDTSDVALDVLRTQIRNAGDALRHVRLHCGPAHDLTGLPKGYFDTIIIHSVIQYFGSVEYLVDVLKRAVEAAAPGARIYVGDVQSKSLLEMCHLAALFDQSNEGSTVRELLAKTRRRVANEQELCVDPQFFQSLGQAIPGLGPVEIQLRRGTELNETTQYHYDVVLNVNGPQRRLDVPVWLDWQRAGMSPEGLEQYLRSEAGESVGLANIPNSRLKHDRALLSLVSGATEETTLGELKAKAAESDGEGWPLEKIWEIAEACGYVADVRWAEDGSTALCDAVLRKSGSPAAAAGVVPAFPGDVISEVVLLEAANAPRKGGSEDLQRELRELLRQSLPDYMMPSAFVLLDELPRLPNGKLDRRSLPNPAAELPLEARTHEPPATPEEEQMVQIWQTALSLEKVGVTDDIFELGGDSLLIFRIVTRAKSAGIDVSPKDMFQHRTIRDVLRHRTVSTGPATRSHIPRISRESYRRTLPS